jgi:hypothetical protein
MAKRILGSTSDPMGESLMNRKPDGAAIEPKHSDLGQIPNVMRERFPGLEVDWESLGLAPGSTGAFYIDAWNVQYVVGEDAKGLYLEYYGSNRFVWGDLRARVYASGDTVDDLDSIVPLIITKVGQDPKETEAAYYKENRRIARELREAGLFPEGDINAHLRTNADLNQPDV